MLSSTQSAPKNALDLDHIILNCLSFKRHSKLWNFLQNWTKSEKQTTFIFGRENTGSVWKELNVPSLLRSFFVIFCVFTEKAISLWMMCSLKLILRDLLHSICNQVDIKLLKSANVGKDYNSINFPLPMCFHTDKVEKPASIWLNHTAIRQSWFAY